MEQCIKDQLFAKTAVAVHIVEEYMLSGQYTAEALMNEYRESIILELKEKSMLASNMFAQADIRYEAENVVCLELLDTIVSAGRKEEIVDLLKEVYSERFHIPAEIRVDYKEPDRTGNMMNRESNRRSMRSLRDGQDSAGKRLRQKEKRRKIR